MTQTGTDMNSRRKVGKIRLSVQKRNKLWQKSLEQKQAGDQRAQKSSQRDISMAGKSANRRLEAVGNRVNH